jgi:hypothetical protein
MRIRNVALLVLLIEISFQSEIIFLSKKEGNNQIEEEKIENTNQNNNNDAFNVLVSLIVISNYI